MIEINRSYPNGVFEAKGNYSDFLEQRDAALHAQANYEAAPKPARRKPNRGSTQPAA